MQAPCMYRQRLTVHAQVELQRGRHQNEIYSTRTTLDQVPQETKARNQHQLQYQHSVYWQFLD